MENCVINKIKTFDCRFADTAADSRAFGIVLESGILTDMINSYFSHKGEPINDFKDRIADYAVESMNQIYRPYGRTVREESVIREYFSLLLDSLVKTA